MAYDKIITIHSRLDRRINYALNPAKTRNGERSLCAALNCQLDTACQDMQETKHRWDKENRPVQGYHIIHSYAPGEVTAEQAQKLSVQRNKCSKIDPKHDTKRRIYPDELHPTTD